MFHLVQQCIDEYRRAGAPEQVRTDRMVCVDVQNRMIDGQCYLLFERGGDRPLLVAKAARSTGGKAVFETEFDNLLKLEQIGMNEHQATIPAPLGRWNRDDVLVTLQAALQGTLMKNVPGRTLFSPAAIDESLEQVLGWWRGFQNRFGVRRTKLSAEVYDEAILGPLGSFEERYLLDGQERAFLNQRFREARPLLGVELPFMARHADFCAANMTLEDQGIGVFDWEFPLQHQTPLFDIFFFFSSVRFPYTRYQGESSHFDSFVAVFWEENYFNRAMRRCLRGLCEEFGIPTDVAPDLLTLSLIQIANMKYQGLIDSHGMGEIEAAGQRVSPEEKLSRWSSFQAPDKNAPFASIRDGVFENLRFLVHHGLPSF